MILTLSILSESSFFGDSWASFGEGERVPVKIPMQRQSFSCSAKIPMQRHSSVFIYIVCLFVYIRASRALYIICVYVPSVTKVDSSFFE